MFRNEKPGPGRFRQFMQFDADTVGAASPAADAEICMMAADCLEALGVKRGDYVIKVNNRKVLDGVMEAIGLGGEANAGRRLTVLRAIDKLDRLGVEGVRALLGAGRKDESGDFTKGAGLDADQIHRGLDALSETAAVQFEAYRVEDGGTHDCRRAHLAFSTWKQSQAGDILKSEQGLDELRADGGAVRGRGLWISDASDRSLRRARARILHWPRLRGGAHFEVNDETGREVRFGSVGGGGRYDGLVARFRAEPVPATGFSIGVSRLLAALRAIKARSSRRPRRPALSSCSLSTATRTRWRTTQRLVASLRQAGIAAELYLGSGGMNAQLKYADRRRSRVAVIQGSNERNAPGGPQVTIRDLKLGAELAKTTKDRADYLELRQRAQFPAPEAELVERVREVLARP